MKNKLMLLFASLSIATTLFAQIPNAGFESWTSMGTYSNPDGWATLNDYTTMAGVYTATAGTPGSPGNSYLKLTSKTVGPTVANGIAVSGQLDPATMQPISGFAFNQQPASLTGKWQHMIYGTSQGSISVTLTRWDAGMNMRMPVASGNVTLSGMAMSWANFTIPLTYSDTQAPDTCIIVMKASGANPTNQDYLWVDNLAFSGNVAGITEASLLSDVSVFPNPAKNNVQVAVNVKEQTSLKVELINFSGAILMEQNMESISGQQSMMLDVSTLAPGHYWLKIQDDKGSVNRMIAVE